MLVDEDIDALTMAGNASQEKGGYMREARSSSIRHLCVCSCAQDVAKDCINSFAILCMKDLSTS